MSWILTVGEDGWKGWKLVVGDLQLEVFPHGDAWESGQPIADDKAHWSGWFGLPDDEPIWQVENEPRTLADQKRAVEAACRAWLRKQLRMMVPTRVTGLSKLYDKMKEETDRDPLFADVHLSALDTLDLVEDLDELAKVLGIDPVGAPHVGDLVAKVMDRQEQERQHGRDEMLIAAMGKIGICPLERVDMAMVVAAMETARREMGCQASLPLSRLGDVTIGRSNRPGALAVTLVAGDFVVASVEVLEGTTMADIEEELMIVMGVKPMEAVKSSPPRTRAEWLNPFIDRDPTSFMEPVPVTSEVPMTLSDPPGLIEIEIAEGCIMKECTGAVVYEGPTGTKLCQVHLDEAQDELGETDSPE